MMIGNLYGITAIAVIGGALFGFDISSMSAMYASYHSLLVLASNNGLVSAPSNTDVTSTKAPMVTPTTTGNALVPGPMFKVGLPLPCRVALSSVLSPLVSSPISLAERRLS